MPISNENPAIDYSGVFMSWLVDIAVSGLAALAVWFFSILAGYLIVRPIANLAMLFLKRVYPSRVLLILLALARVAWVERSETQVLPYP